MSADASRPRLRVVAPEGAWVSRGRRSAQTGLAVGCAVAGVAFVVLCHDFPTQDGNVLAGFLLGLLLLGIGVAALLATAAQTVVVDRASRQIVIEDVGRLGSRTRVIPFDDIARIGVGYVGKRSSHVGWHYLSLTLRSGGTYPLFAPGRFYPGSTRRAEVESWKARLEGMLAEGGTGGRPGRERF